MMVSNRITEGVGKKIVEALKMQSDVEIQNVDENPALQAHSDMENSSDIEFINDGASQDLSEDSYIEPQPPQLNQDIHFNSFNTFQQNNSFEQQDIPRMINFGNSAIEKESISNDIEGFEMPTNVAVLKQLINQLPAGVSKQTGAQIIRQTMEALGISMKNVLQEAQQVQEGLNSSVRECQATIMDYKRQIGVLEKQAQKYQKQYGMLNDIISLFIQTNN